MSMDHVDKILEQWQHERPDLETGPMEVIGRILRLSQQLSREMAKTFAVFDLNSASFDVLATLRRSGPPYSLSPGDLLATTMVTSGTMTNRIDQLVKAELVERVQNPDDGRSVTIKLSEKGFEVIDAAVTEHVQTQKNLTAGLSDKECVALNKLHKKMLLGFKS